MLGQSVADVLVRAPAFLLGIGLHEWAHAYVADRAGDPTPRQQGRLTMNPLAHLDPLGTLCILFAPIGWGKPVQVRPGLFQHPARDHMRVALAGPLTNLVLVALGLLGLEGLGALRVSPSSLAVEVCFWVVVLNLMLALFNLVPVPPLDGSRVARYALGARGAWLDSMQPYGALIILVLVTQGALQPVFGFGLSAVTLVRGRGLGAELVFLVLTTGLWVANAGLFSRRAPPRAMSPEPRGLFRTY